MVDLYQHLKENALTHSSLYHYTNVNALSLILENRSLRASRIDKVNDSMENKRITSLWNKRVFILCFTHDLSNQRYFFEEYGSIRLQFSPNSINSDAVFSDPYLQNRFAKWERTALEHKSYKTEKDWCIRDITIADVYYTDDLNAHKSYDGNESNAGLIKCREGKNDKGEIRVWENEKETRLRIAFRPIGNESVFEENKFKYPRPCFDHVFVELPRIESIAVSGRLVSKEKEKLLQLLKKHGYLKLSSFQQE